MYYIFSSRNHRIGVAALLLAGKQLDGGRTNGAVLLTSWWLVVPVLVRRPQSVSHWSRGQSPLHETISPSLMLQQ